MLLMKGVTRKYDMQPCVEKEVVKDSGRECLESITRCPICNGTGAVAIYLSILPTGESAKRECMVCKGTGLIC